MFTKKIKFIFQSYIVILLFFGLYACTRTEIITDLEGSVYRGPINHVKFIR